VHSPGPIIWTLKDLTIYLRAYHFFVTLGVRKNSLKLVSLLTSHGTQTIEIISYDRRYHTVRLGSDPAKYFLTDEGCH